MARRTNFSKRGAGYIEVLVSTIILVLCLLTAISLFGFSMKLVDKTGDEGVAYNIARQNLEKVRQWGFANANVPEGDYIRYYNAKGVEFTSPVTTGSDQTRFTMIRNVASDRKIIGTNAPADNAIRSVTVKVYYYPTISLNTQVEAIGTILVRSGV